MSLEKLVKEKAEPLEHVVLSRELANDMLEFLEELYDDLSLPSAVQRMASSAAQRLQLELDEWDNS